jgi:hypothetical protein
MKSLTNLRFALLAGVVTSCGAPPPQDATNATDAGARGGDAGPTHFPPPTTADDAGGTTAAGDASATSEADSGVGTPPPHVVGACNSLAAPGTWEQITPPTVVKQLPGPGNCTFGVQAFVLDPSKSGTVYLATCHMGMWKTTDCGSSWVHINTGKNGAVIDTSRQWTFTIDPIDPNILYANSGYGDMANGALKSTNGGVDWQTIWPPPADPSLGQIVANNFVNLIAMDPTDHLHLLVSFHAVCSAPYNPACFAESHDAGGTWKMLNGRPDWSGGEAQAMYFLDKGTTWLWGSQTNGLWRTVDSGANWTLVDSNSGGHNSAPVYNSQNAFYLVLNTGILRSPDGITWSNVLNKTMLGITGNATTLFASVGFPWNPGSGPPPYQPFWSSPKSDGLHWTQVSSPMLSNGGVMNYEPDHHILYSSNLGAGFWRVVLP